MYVDRKALLGVEQTKKKVEEGVMVMAKAAATATAKPVRKARAKGTYDEIRARVEAGKTVMIQGRGDAQVEARKYSLDADQIAKLHEAAKATGAKFINPFSLRKGVYMHQVEALHVLGLNKWHPLKDVREAMKTLMKDVEKVIKQGKNTVTTNAWAHFYNKPARDGATNPLTGDDKIVQNFRVLQRVGGNDRHPYGMPLRQFAMSADIKFEDAGGALVPSFRLNTTWKSEAEAIPVYINPVKRGKKAAEGKPAAKPAAAKKAAAKADAKPQAAKPKAAKSKKAVVTPPAPAADVPEAVKAPVVEPPKAEDPKVETIATPEPAVEAPKATEPVGVAVGSPSDEDQELK